MLDYDRIDVSEGINLNKTGDPRKFIICQYWHFLWINCRFQAKVCEGCHDMSQISMSFNDTTMLMLEEIVIEFILGHD